MFRYSLIFGAIIGVVVIAFMTVTMIALGTDNVSTSELAGYAVMLAVLSLVFIGIKRFRDVEHGGVIKFTQAAGVGVGIAVVAAIFYVISWEFYLYTSDYAFMTSYTEAMIASINAQDLAEAERAAQIAEIESMSESYRNNSLFRYGITFLEIFPVGLVVALLSAAILKNPKVLPARADA